MRKTVLWYPLHRHLLALGSVVALANTSPAMAQSGAAADAEAADLDTVTVTGIRGSLQSSMLPRILGNSLMPTWPNPCSAFLASPLTALLAVKVPG